jgi:hypothetical protein
MTTEDTQYSEANAYQPEQISVLLEQTNQKRKALGEAPIHISTFYRYVEKGLIGSYPPNRKKRQRAEWYKKSDVDAFLKGGLGATRARKASSKTARLPLALPSAGQVDIVRPEDLPALWLMEVRHLGFSNALPTTITWPWMQKNEQVYWMLYDPQNRDDADGIWAVLGMVPLREELIQRLLRKELTLKDLTQDDILVYEPGQKYSCYITSTTTAPGREAAIRQLLQHILAYWCENSIAVEQIVVSGTLTPKETALMHLVVHCFFAEIDAYGEGDVLAWRLRPLSRFNPVSFIQEYQKCIQRKKSIERANKPMVIATPAQEPLEIERQLEHEIRPDMRNFERLRRRLYRVAPSGHIEDERVKRDVWFRRINSDDDILACLHINASYFGASKFTDAELVTHYRSMLNKNPDIYQVLQVDQEIVGFISAFPLPMDIINRILRSEIRMSQVSANDLLTYEPGVPINVYLQSIAVHKRYSDEEKRRLSTYMVSGYTNLINEAGKRGIEFQAIYTRSDEIDGINMSYGLGFQKMPPIPGVEKLVFQLDFSRRDLPFLFEYHHALEEYQIRQSANAIRNAVS